MHHRNYAVILAALCWSSGLPGDAYAAPAFLPDCAGKAEIANAKLARVEPDGTLILPGGQSVRLEGLRLPLDGPRDIAARAIGTLQKLAGAESLTLTAPPPRLDRYGRLRVQAFGPGWLQLSLLEQGLARVQVSPDRQECAPDLYEAEARARARGAGLWALERYRVRTPQQLKGATGSFQLVEGLVSHIGRADGRTFIDFGERFSAVIGPGDRRAFRDFDFDELSGRRIRIRGIVQDYRGGAKIALSHPAQIEMLDP
jgi:endonuclease YncB( thermonuclease family)